MHFLSFLLNVASWVGIGMILSIHIYRLKTWRVNKTRFYFTTISAAFTGGLLGELANGSPDFGISIINLFVAAFAGVLAIYLAFPRYAKLFIEELKQYETVFAAFVRTQIQTFRQK